MPTSSTPLERQSIARHSRPRPPIAWLLTLALGIVLSCFQPLTVSALPSLQDERPETHTVAPGDTLSGIAQRYGVTLRALMAHNGITAPDQIRIGQELLLPEPTEDSREASRAGPAPEGRVTILNRTVLVRQGDTLGRIALRHGVALDALAALNNLDVSEPIVTGESLLLPATGEDLRVAGADEIYVVQEGDSLGFIAESYDLPLAELLAANPRVQADAIFPGQKLLIPGAPSATSAPAIGPARAGFFYHRVQPGETMSHLAQEYNTTPQAIVRYNGLPDESTIYSGLEVRIPYGPPALSRRRPPTPETGSEFIVSITRQNCWVMQNGSVLHSWRCSTGQGQWATRTGTFPIKTKLETAQSSAYRLDMPYWLGLYDVGEFENGIHGIPMDWTTGEKLWDSLVGQPATFGCAMLLDEDAATLFGLSYLGMPVHIVD